MKTIIPRAVDPLSDKYISVSRLSVSTKMLHVCTDDRRQKHMKVILDSTFSNEI